MFTTDAHVPLRSHATTLGRGKVTTGPLTPEEQAAHARTTAARAASNPTMASLLPTPAAKAAGTAVTLFDGTAKDPLAPYEPLQHPPLSAPASNPCSFSYAFYCTAAQAAGTVKKSDITSPEAGLATLESLFARGVLSSSAEPVLGVNYKPGTLLPGQTIPAHAAAAAAAAAAVPAKLVPPANVPAKLVPPATK